MTKSFALLNLRVNSQASFYPDSEQLLTVDQLLSLDTLSFESHTVTVFLTGQASCLLCWLIFVPFL